MKKFRYKLQQILSIRKIQVEEAEGELAKAQFALHQELNQLQEIQNCKERALSQTWQGVVNSSLLMNNQHYLAGLEQKLRSQEGKVMEARTEVARAQQKLQEARLHENQLEKHRDKQMDLWRQEAMREENKQADEVSSRLNQSAQRQDQQAEE